MSAKNSNADLVLSAASRLVPAEAGAEKLRHLPIPATSVMSSGWSWIALPDWASDIVPTGKKGLFVPAQIDGKNWRSYDWWQGAAALLTSAAERKQEAEKGPSHSYASRLDQEMKPAFEYAWVNRILLFLRRWWTHDNDSSENEVFGPVPPAIVHLTHDVDAISKTVAIRSKQAVFSLYNKRVGAATRFLLRPGDYWQFDKITGLEDRYGRRSLWNFYGGRGGLFRSPKEHLFDPAYNVNSKRLQDQIRAMASDGHRIGLHPRFDTWRDADRMSAEKQAIEVAQGREITDIRQHWLRFSFAETWKTQKAAGLTHDHTLGFNDRFGFRNSAALSFTDPDSGMRVIPMVLMDSHLHDYADMSEEIRFETIDLILDELVATGGEASVIWHQRVFHRDYGWGATYEYLLEGMKKRRIASPEAD